MEDDKSRITPADKLKRLRDLIKEGEASGEPVPFDMEEFIAEKRRQLSKA
jgi:hypothetical protein